MKHLIISREYPPAPGGGIGTYVYNISRLLAEAGETVHVIGQKWEGAEKDIEEKMSGKLIIHRIPLHDWTNTSEQKIHPELKKVKDISSDVPLIVSDDAQITAAIGKKIQRDENPSYTVLIEKVDDL